MRKYKESRRVKCYSRKSLKITRQFSDEHWRHFTLIISVFLGELHHIYHFPLRTCNVLYVAFTNSLCTHLYETRNLSVKKRGFFTQEIKMRKFAISCCGIIYSLPRDIHSDEIMNSTHWNPIFSIYKKRLLVLTHKVYYDTNIEPLNDLTVNAKATVLI